MNKKIESNMQLPNQIVNSSQEESSNVLFTDEMYIGIDKATISGFILHPDINFRILESNPNAQIEYNGLQYFQNINVSSNKDFSCIKINDNNYGFQLAIGTKRSNSYNCPYIFLTTTIHDNKCKNLFPLKINEYKKHIDNILIYVRGYYGLDISSRSPCFNSVEINVNIELNQSFSSYSNVLDLLMNISSKHYKTYCIYKNPITNIKESFYKGNKSMKFKFYNKTSQMKNKHGIVLPVDILRLEYTLMNTEKIKNSLGSNKIADLTDRKIESFIKNQFEKDFLTPLIKYQNDIKRKLKQMLKKATENRKWVSSLSNILYGYIDENNNKGSIKTFDINLLKPFFKDISPINFSNNWLSFNNICPKSLKNVDEKLEEIKNKILGSTQRNQEH